jgi:hypothetical protein
MRILCRLEECSVYGNLIYRKGNKAMERLTDRFDDGIVGVMSKDKTDLISIFDVIEDPVTSVMVQNAIDQLNNYEATELKPTECASKWDMENECNLRDSEITSLREQLENYIDTGLTPEEIRVQVELKNNCFQRMKNNYEKLLKMWDSTCDGYVTLWRELQAYKDVEEQGLLIKFPPCEPGDIIYEIDAPEHGVIICEVIRVYHSKGWICGVKSNGKFSETYIDIKVIDGHGKGSSYQFEASDIGKLVFITRDAAEEALKGGVPE